MPHDGFIRYASADKAVGDAVDATREHARLRCGIARRDVIPGVEYAAALMTAIAECRGFRPVFTSRSPLITP